MTAISVTDYVLSVISDSKYGGDIEWVKANLDPRHVRRIEAEYTRQQREEAWDYARSEVRSLPSWYNRETGKGGFDLQPLGPDEGSEEGAWDAVMSILDVNPYRKETP